MEHLVEKDKKDLEEFLAIYRTAKRLGIFFVWLLGIAFTIASLWLIIKQIKAP